MPRNQVTTRVRVDNIPYALSFSGSQRVVLDTMGNLGSSVMGAFSWGIWCRSVSKGTLPQYFFGCSNSTGGNYLLCGISRNSTNVGCVNFQARDNSSHSLGAQVSDPLINDGAWHLVIGTKDATNQVAGMKIYIDGSSKTLTTISNTALTDSLDFNRAMAIGSGLGSGAVANAWVGELSRTFFFQRELTPTECSDWWLKKKVPTGEFAGYNFNEGSGTAVADTQGNHSGTLTSAAQWITDTPYKSRPQRTP